MKKTVIGRMVDDIRKKYGSESKVTIHFCKVCEGRNYPLMKALYKMYMEREVKG